MRAMGARRGRLSAPWPRFHGVDRADVYIIIHVRACCCGECELNPPPSPPIPRRRLPLPHAAPTYAHAQRHALPEHFRAPPQPRRTPTQRRCLPRRSSPLAPSIFSRPSRALLITHAAPTHARRLRDTFPADRTTHSPSQHRRPPPHSDAPFPSTSAPPRSADTRPQAARCIPRRPHNSLPAEDLRPPRTATRPSRALPLPHAAPTHARRLRDAFPADRTTHSPQRHAASPSVPLRAQKNGTAQCMCDAECLGRPSLRSVIWVGEPRAVRRRCGALACRRGA